MLKLLVIGNLGKDATVNTVNGKNVINFTAAHTEKYKDAQGNQVDKTTWVECAYWTERVGIVPYLKKGTQIYAEGIPEIRNYTTSDGRTGSSLVLRVMNVQLLGSKVEGSIDTTSQASQSQAPSASYSQPAPAYVAPAATSDSDDLPF